MLKFAFTAALLCAAALAPTSTATAQAGGQVAPAAGDKGGDKKVESTGKVGEMLPNVAASVMRGDKAGTIETAKNGKPTVIFLVGVTCPATKPYAERLVALEQAYMAKGVDFVYCYTNVPESAATKTQFHKDCKFTGAFWNDEKAAFAKAIKAGKTGEAIITDKDGKVVYRGGIDDDMQNPAKVKSKFVASALEELLAGKAVTKTTGNIFG
ncbi:MAG: redoxin domain-containing protein [Planctomycetes bacterium]|nr:redoxin domain-containing protein [Planctomycetota bacterium]